MRERIARMMIGRNGNDQLNRFLLLADVILVLLASLLGRNGVGSLLYTLVVLLLGLTASVPGLQRLVLGAAAVVAGLAMASRAHRRMARNGKGRKPGPLGMSAASASIRPKT